MTDARVLEAARNNAEWCDAMCRAHGVRGEFGARVWSSARRTPPYYPDAVTLDPAATAGEVLGGIDGGAWASVKDSFARLDLDGFDVLFEAQWIRRDAPRETEPDLDRDLDWGTVKDPATLREWERAWSGGHDTELFLPALLDAATIVYGRADGDIVTGAVLNESAQVVGVSNVFSAGRDVGDAWAGTLAMAARLFPGRPLVGYETDMEPAARHGFVPIGPLRVWLKEG